MPSAQRSPAPIRFDLITVFVATTMWAGLCGAMNLLNFPTGGYLLISTLLITVVAAQFCFRRLRRPYPVTFVAAMAYALCSPIAWNLWKGRPGLSIGYDFVYNGVVFGFGAIVFLDAVFVISMIARTLLQRFFPSE